MFPEIKIQSHLEGAAITYKDVTGDYHETENPGGYGSPNYGRGDVERAELHIYYNGDLIDVTDVTQKVKNGSGDEVFLYQLEGLYDGVYSAKMSVAFVGEPTIAYSFPFVREWVLKKVTEQINHFWARLAMTYNSYKFRQLSQECIWMNTHLSGLEVLADEEKTAEFVSLLRIVKDRITVNQRFFANK